MVLPRGFRRVKYIESHGEQHLDIGIAHNATDKFHLEIDVEYTTVAPANQIMGFTGNQGCGIGTSGSAWWEASGSVSANTRYNLAWSVEGTAYTRVINGTSYTGKRTLTNFTTSMYLFAALESATEQNITYYCYCRLYSAAAYVNDVLVRKLIPCVYGSAAGLYDTVNGVFYSSAGFTAGDYLDDYGITGYENVGGVLKKYIDGYENVGGVLKKILYGYQNIGGTLVPLAKKLFTWKKHYTVEKNTYELEEEETYVTNMQLTSGGSIDAYKNISINKDTGEIIFTDKWSGTKTNYRSVYKQYPYAEYNGKVIRFYDLNGSTLKGLEQHIRITSTSYQMGDYIETVESQNETEYPYNGIHTDGYWYVKQ